MELPNSYARRCGLLLPDVDRLYDVLGFDLKLAAASSFSVRIVTRINMLFEYVHRRPCDPKSSNHIPSYIMLLLVLAITFILHSNIQDAFPNQYPHLHALGNVPLMFKYLVLNSGSRKDPACVVRRVERKAVVDLFCPNSSLGQPKVRKVTTKAPSDCMCRPCTAIEQGTVLASDIAGYIDSVGPMMNSLVSYQ
ncbi:unnamed protein product [Lepeophtheirus salmonis]|uniref:(salmon louse) hypothetical protein n=1 Tax=Lepeophtheirus salmonis TaxID=72036 RepID=A0A7R8HCS8_LEPSM|nr:unnamed protein product [Lepeophtheirus salmonis]CAF3007812.1 unnamed protein product [Lepeophtheirus salmonis]